MHVVNLSTSEKRSEELLRLQDLPLPNPIQLLSISVSAEHDW